METYFATYCRPKSYIKNVIGKIEKSYSIILINPGQTAYVSGRFLGESGRLVVDIIETCDLEELEGYLVAIDFEKVFDSLNNSFLITALEYYGFGNHFIDRIKI